MSRYQYAVIRYVPDVVRDEAINVGVIVREVSGEQFDFRFLPRAATIRRLWPEADQNLVKHFEKILAWMTVGSQPSLLEEPSQGLPNIGHPADREFFARARSEFNGTLQLSLERGILKESLRDALNWTYAKFVAEPQPVRRPINYQSLAPFRARARLWSAFERKSLLGPGRVQKQFVVEGRHAPWTFDLGYRNGVLNLINSLSLDASEEANLGRALVFKGMIEDIGAKHDAEHRVLGIAVVDTHPAHPSPGSDQAQQMLHDADIDVVPLANLSELVQRIESEFALEPDQPTRRR